MAALCEHFHQVDLAWLKRQKMLEPGRSSSIKWSRAGRPTGSISIVAGLDRVRLAYRHRAPDGDWRDVHETVPFTTTETCFGGRRRWFECPGCGKACRVLYGGSRFLCRRCRGLRYESQYESAWSRTTSSMQKLRMRLGGSANLTEAFPPRPKGMQHRTYARLRTLDTRLLIHNTAQLAALVDGIRGRSSPR